MDGLTLLVIDDDESICKALRRTLRQEGYAIHLAHSGDAGLALLRCQHVDLVLSDNYMPGLTGLEVLSQVRESHPTVGRVLLTGNADAEVAQQALAQGTIHKYVAKPWDDLELKGALKEVLEQAPGSRPQAPGVLDPTPRRT